jgi:hypothetical protein
MTNRCQVVLEPMSPSSSRSVFVRLNHQVEIIEGVLRDEATVLVKSFFEKKRTQQKVR